MCQGRATRHIFMMKPDPDVSGSGHTFRFRPLPLANGRQLELREYYILSVIAILTAEC